MLRHSLQVNELFRLELIAFTDDTLKDLLHPPPEEAADGEEERATLSTEEAEEKEDDKEDASSNARERNNLKEEWVFHRLS